MQRDQHEEGEVEPHQPAVEARECLEEVVVDDPEAADQRKGEHVGGERREQVDQRAAEVLVGDVGSLDVEHEQRDRHRHDAVREGDEAGQIATLHAQSKDRAPDGAAAVRRRVAPSTLAPPACRCEAPLP